MGLVEAVVKDEAEAKLSSSKDDEEEEEEEVREDDSMTESSSVSSGFGLVNRGRLIGPALRISSSLKPHFRTDAKAEERSFHFSLPSFWRNAFVA